MPDASQRRSSIPLVVALGAGLVVRQALFERRLRCTLASRDDELHRALVAFRDEIERYAKDTNRGLERWIKDANRAVSRMSR